MEKQEKIIVILLCMVLLSLVISYAAFFSGGGDGQAGYEDFSSSSQPGDYVRFEGDILSKRMTYAGDHLLMDVDYGPGVVKVFIPSGNGAQDINSRVHEDDHVIIAGIVDEYQDQIEVVVQDVGGVTLS